MTDHGAFFLKFVDGGFDFSFAEFVEHKILHDFQLISSFFPSERVGKEEISPFSIRSFRQHTALCCAILRRA